MYNNWSAIISLYDHDAHSQHCQVIILDSTVLIGILWIIYYSWYNPRIDI